VPMILCWVYPATAQIEHGSVGVVYFTKYEISVAADSRGTVKDNSIPPDDTVCKIAALGGNVIFVLTGVTRYPRTWTMRERRELHMETSYRDSVRASGMSTPLRTNGNGRWLKS
jgi:hypothetical protein